MLPASDQEIMRLDITMQNSSAVYILKPINHLHRTKQYGHLAKATVAFDEELLQREAQQIHDHDVIIAVQVPNAQVRSPEVIHAGNAHVRSAIKNPQEICLLPQFRAPRIPWFNFHRYLPAFLLIANLCGVKDIAERSGSDFLPKPDK